MTDRTEPELSDAVEALLSDADVWAELDPGVIDDTVSAVLREAQRAASDAAPVWDPPSGAGSTDDVPVASVVDLSARRSARLQGALLGAAAAAVLLLGGFLVGSALQSSGDDADVVIALAPTEREPGAFGSIELTETPDGSRIILDTEGLPPAPDGFYYEAWLRTGPDFGVSAGTFHLRGGGDSEIELWAGVSPNDFPLFTVTLQPVGMEESSGQVVLAGRFDS